MLNQLPWMKLLSRHIPYKLLIRKKLKWCSGNAQKVLIELACMLLERMPLALRLVARLLSHHTRGLFADPHIYSLSVLGMSEHVGREFQSVFEDGCGTSGLAVSLC